MAHHSRLDSAILGSVGEECAERPSRKPSKQCNRGLGNCLCANLAKTLEYAFIDGADGVVQYSTRSRIGLAGITMLMNLTLGYPAT